MERVLDGDFIVVRTRKHTDGRIQVKVRGTDRAIKTFYLTADEYVRRVTNRSRKSRD